MHPLVRDLFKRIILVSRTYPGGSEYVLREARRHINAHKLVTEEIDIKRAVASGRYWVRELAAVDKIKKFREMSKRYDSKETV